MPQTHVVDNTGIYHPLTAAYIANGSGAWTPVQQIYIADGTGAWKKVFPPNPTYAVVVNPQTTNEGSSVTFTLTTTNVSNGTLVPYTISGTGINSIDISGAATSGNFTVSNNTAQLTFTIAADNATEGTEYLTLTVGGAATTVTINDTSVNVPIYYPSISMNSGTYHVGDPVSVMISGGPPYTSVYLVTRDSGGNDMVGATSAGLDSVGGGSYASSVDAAYVPGNYTLYAYFDNNYQYGAGNVVTQSFTVI